MRQNVAAHIVYCYKLGKPMKRREFLILISGTVCWPLAARAQQSARLPTIGIFGSVSAAWHKPVTELVERLHELGHVENRTVTIEYRWSEGRNERYGEIAAELVRLNVDVIVALGTPAIVAAKKATSVIPIVFPLASDPVGDGLVASLARPGGNITGLSNEQRDLGGKRLEVLREIVPNLARLAVLANPRNPTAMLNVREIQALAPRLGLGVIAVELGRADDIAPAIEQLKGRAQALYIVGDPFVLDNQFQIVTLALAARLPTIHNERGYVEAGGLLSYGPSFFDLFRRAGDDVDKILKGSKPADIPVELPTRFELVINLKTAKALGLTVPDKLLALADAVIE
jgi:putative tryptophan/tyrosine transport system substrate-binding protein